MLKKICALISISVLTVLLYPSFLGNGTVAVGGKSAGEFISFDKVTPSIAFGCDGVSFTLDGSNYQEIVKKYSAKLTHSFTLDGVTNLYFYSEKLPKKEIIFGKKVNLHVAINGQKITVGSPIIYYGY